MKSAAIGMGVMAVVIIILLMVVIYGISYVSDLQLQVAYQAKSIDSLNIKYTELQTKNSELQTKYDNEYSNNANLSKIITNMIESSKSLDETNKKLKDKNNEYFLLIGTLTTKIEEVLNSNKLLNDELLLYKGEVYE